MPASPLSSKHHPPAAASRHTFFGWLAAAALACLASTAQAASFPCNKASTPAEKAVCASPELSNLDEYLARYYAAARLGLQHAQGCLVQDQRAWVRTVRDACQDATCLQGAYLERLAVLHALQPGASSLRTVELPRVPALVWIVPPAADQVAAPRNVSTTPLSASGRIVNDVASADGYVLQAEGGVRHLIVPLMFLEPPTTDALAQLARPAEARYQVRGRAEATARGAKAFAASQCTFVYRTSP